MTTSLSAPISFWNVANLLAYVANAAIVYSVGMYGILGQGSNAELSAKYQTLITPAGWAFSIWGIIFISQLLWVVLQLFWPQYRVKALEHVHYYNYVLVCLAQIGWTIAFGYEVIWLSMIFMALILMFLMRIVSRRLPLLQDETITEYALLEFPFAIHAGWIMAATLLNANVVLVAYHVSANVEILAALISLVLVLLAAFHALALHDFTMPLVLLWALSGIYSELGNPNDSIGTKFSDGTVPLVQKATAVTILAVAVSFCLRLWPRTSSLPTDPNRTLQEPLTAPTGTAK